MGWKNAINLLKNCYSTHTELLMIKIIQKKTKIVNDFKCVSVHVGAQGLSPGDNLKNVTSIFSITDSWFSSFEPLDRQKDE